MASVAPLPVFNRDDDGLTGPRFAPSITDPWENFQQKKLEECAFHYLIKKEAAGDSPALGATVAPTQQSMPAAAATSTAPPAANQTDDKAQYTAFKYRLSQLGEGKRVSK